MKKLFASFIALLVLLVCSACSDDSGGTNLTLGRNDTGELEVFAQINGDPLGVDTVRVTLSRERPIPATRTAILSRTGNVWSTTIGRIPPGTIAAGTAWKIVGEAFRASEPDRILFRGEVDGLEVNGTAAALVSLLLAQLDRPVPFANGSPIIDGLFATSLAIRPTDKITLTATAHDPDGEPLTFAWSGAAGFSAPSAATTEWTPPAKGSFTLSLVVSDPRGATDGISVTIAVDDVPAPVGGALVQASVNRWPVVTTMTASKTLLAPGGDAVDLTATATDADGDALTHVWTSTCGATFSPQGPSVRATTAARAAGTDCTWTDTVTDARGGQTTGSVTLHIGNPPPITDL